MILFKNNKKSIVVFISALFINFYTLAEAVDSWQLNSLNKTLNLQVKLGLNDDLQYKLSLKTDTDYKTIVGWSALGLVTRSFGETIIPIEKIDSDLSSTISFIGKKVTQSSENYQLITGKRLSNFQEYKLLTLNFKDKETPRLFDVEFRLYDDGLAFRYRLPEQSQRYHKMLSEVTEFNLGTSGQHWGQAYDFVTKHHPSYETTFGVHPTGTNTPKEAGTGWAFPALFQKNFLDKKIWIFVHESGVTEQFHGSHLASNAEQGIYKIAPPLADSALGYGSTQPSALLPWNMPWRYISVSESLGDIVESNRVFDLAPPNLINNTDWIKPGKVAWSWWSDHASSKNEKTLQSFIDLAAEMKWPYTLIDANWNLISDTILTDLVAYAKQRNVGLFFWYNSGGKTNFVGEQPRNRMTDKDVRRAEFAKLQKLGVKGIKVDFFQSDKQDTFQQYFDILADAADHQLMVGFHGCTVPRGWERTWPNLMTMESVRGGEFYTFGAGSNYNSYAPYQATILPFTRNVVGSMDYTPVSFSNPYNERLTTDSHEAALPIIYESGLLHFADGVQGFSTLPNDIKGYFSEVPTVWQQTRYLSGHPGDHVVIARFDGKYWYIAAINGNNTPVNIEFVFPEVIGKKAELIQDDKSGDFLPMTTITMKKKTTLTLLPYGGQVWKVVM